MEALGTLFMVIPLGIITIILSLTSIFWSCSYLEKQKVNAMICYVALVFALLSLVFLYLAYLAGG